MADAATAAPAKGRAKKTHALPGGPGHNGPSDDELRHYVDGLLKLNAERDAIRAKINTYRKTWKARGVELGEMDDRIKQLDWTPEEIRDHWATARRYAEVLGQPVGAQLDMFGKADTPEDQREAIRWFAYGRMHGLSGKGAPEQPPAGCPEEHRQGYGDGWEQGNDERLSAILRAMEKAPGDKLS